MWYCMHQARTFWKGFDHVDVKKVGVQDSSEQLVEAAEQPCIQVFARPCMHPFIH